jgi:hypothetical protein
MEGWTPDGRTLKPSVVLVARSAGRGRTFGPHARHSTPIPSSQTCDYVCISWRSRNVCEHDGTLVRFRMHLSEATLDAR